MRSRMPLTIASALALMLVAIVAAPAAGAPGGNSDAAKAEHARIVSFWTSERMARAIPRDLAPNDKASPAAKGGTPGKPGGGGGGGGGGGDPTAVTGVRWTKGGDVADQTGKVYFVISPWAYVCSGAIVNDSRSGNSLVLTAGHCAYDSSKGFVTNWMFIPNFDADPVGGYPPACGNTLHGCWTAQALVVHKGFAGQSGFTSTATRHDWAFAVVGAGGNSGQQLDSLGSYPIQYEGGITAGERVTSFGYPAASPYDGTKLIWCAGNAFADGLNGGNTWGLKCNATGGTSGGPWIDDVDESTGNGGTLSSVNSYRYNGGDSIYGPKFNSATQATYNAANAATGNTIVQ